MAAIVFAAGLATGQKLPPTSRTVYKCVVAGKTVYSDEPCLGATKVDVEPTRGLDRSSGQQWIGADVAHERSREGVADAIKPITGMDAKQLDRAGRRQRLASDAQRKCVALDRRVGDDEQAERTASGPDKVAAQHELYILRASGITSSPVTSVSMLER